MPAVRDFEPAAAEAGHATGLHKTNTNGSRLPKTSFDADPKAIHPTRSSTIKKYNAPEPSNPSWLPGAEPGIDTAALDEMIPGEVTDLKARCDIRIIDFSLTQVQHVDTHNDGLMSALEQPRPDRSACRWISVNGLSWDVIKALGNKYSLHRLAIEDLVNTHTRTKVDWYETHAFIVLTLQKLVRLHQDECKDRDCSTAAARRSRDQYDVGAPQHWWRRMWRRRPEKAAGDLPYFLDKNGDGTIDEFIKAHSGTSESAPLKPIRTMHRYESAQIPEHTAFMEKHSTLASEDLAVSVEQVAIFLLADNTVISFFEHSAEDVESPIRERLDSSETMLRRSADASMLVQAIIDAVVDLVVPVKDAYNKARKELQVDAMINPNIKTSRALHIFGEEIDMLQNLFKPIVHLVNALRDHNSEPAAPTPRVADPPVDARPLENPQPAPETIARDHDGGRPTRNQSDWRKTSSLGVHPGARISITPLAHTYFGDVLDHCITLIQTFEQLDASATNISTLIFNTVGAKTNNFMMILAVVTVFFAPLTFVSGYFGMNFANGKGLNHDFAFFWAIAGPSTGVFMCLVFATMVWENVGDFFKKRGVRASRFVRDQKRKRH